MRTNSILALAFFFTLAVAAQAAGSAVVTAEGPADVIVDGQRVGTAPVTVSGLAAGAHDIRVVSTATGETKTFTMVAPSRVAVEKSFHASFERPVAVTVVKAGGMLTVLSNARALVYLDKALVGPAPLSITDVGAGYHVLEAVNERTGEVLVKPLSLPDTARFERTVEFVFPASVVRLEPLRYVRYPTTVVVAPSYYRGGHYYRSSHDRGWHGGYDRHRGGSHHRRR
ncbi:MAG: PEGA domain-containing protein [Candidatus Riflebacteria bacterium]|nr:PEGA domain-containing protein [Candidatus Riflebacteria bacterium]